MKQIVRRVIDRKGKIQLIELPEPHLGPNQVLVQNGYSLISSGTELRTLSKTPAELVRQTLSDPWMLILRSLSNILLMVRREMKSSP